MRAELMQEQKERSKCENRERRKGGEGEEVTRKAGTWREAGCAADYVDGISYRCGIARGR